MFESTILPYVLAPLGAYLIGSLSFAYLAGKVFRGIDIRQHGSGNLGAANVVRILGWKIGLPVFFLDMAKGFFPVFFGARYISQISGANSGLMVVIIGTAAVIGHMFTLYHSFKGGKGVATGAGVLLAAMPKAIGLALLVFVLVFSITRIVSLGSILASVAAGILVVTLYNEPFGAERLPITIFSLVIISLVIIRHKSNIKRLIRGEESKMKFSKK